MSSSINNFIYLFIYFFKLSLNKFCSFKQLHVNIHMDLFDWKDCGLLRVFCLVIIVAQNFDGWEIGVAIRFCVLSSVYIEAIRLYMLTLILLI